MAIHLRGHALIGLKRYKGALADFSESLTRHPKDGHLCAYRGICLFTLMRYGEALDQLEAALHIDPVRVRAIFNLDTSLNNKAWELATGSVHGRNPALAARMAVLAVSLSPDESMFFNTSGVAQYRAGRFSEAVETLTKSLAASNGRSDAFDLFFLAMAYHRLDTARKPSALSVAPCVGVSIRRTSTHDTSRSFPPSAPRP